MPTPFPVVPWPTPAPITPVPMPVPHGIPDVAPPEQFRYGSGTARSRVDRFLSHTYDRQAPESIPTDPVIERGKTGSWGDQEEDFVTPPLSMETAASQGSVPCLLYAEERSELDQDGFVLVTWYTMYVAADDPIDNGYQVSNVTDQDDRVILAGPISVLASSPNAPTGPVVYRVATMIARRPGF